MPASVQGAERREHGPAVTFEECFERVVGHEGKLSLARSDAGNWTGGKVGKGKLRGTMYGISAAAYPSENIAAVTLDRARELYRRDYWGPAGCDAMPAELRSHLFDLAVNSGVTTAIECLQAAVGETVDGILGPLTLQAVQSTPVLRIIARLYGHRLRHLASAAGWRDFGRGWAIRCADYLTTV
mgnify:CR=1 FL=1